MRSILLNIAHLREMMLNQEEMLGLQDLSHNEIDVLCAFRSVEESNRTHGIPSDEVKAHHILRNMKHATYHRALRGLVAKGALCQDGYGHYIFGERLRKQMKAV